MSPPYSIPDGFEIDVRGETFLSGPGAPEPAPAPSSAVLLLMGLSLIASRRS